MKNVYVFVPYMTGFGGTETVITNFFQKNSKFLQNNFCLKLFCIGGYSNDQWISKIENKKIIKLSSIKFIRTIEYLLFLPFILFFQTKKLKDEDIVISTNPIMWFLLFYLKKIRRKDYKVISWYHYSFNRKPVRALYLKSADEYFAISSGIANQLFDLGIPKNRVHVIYNPVLKNTVSIKRTPKNQGTNFLYVGRIMLDGQKNMRYMLDALSGVNGDWNLNIYGEGNISEVSRYAKKLKIDSNIHFHGFKKDLWRELKGIDSLILSSKYEGFPMVLNEAISVGIPVISVDCPTGPRDIVNKDNGILVPMSNPSELRDSIQEFIDRKYTNFQNVEKIKKSISRFYIDQYTDNILHIIEA